MWAAENLSISSKPKFSIGQAFARWFPTPQLLAPRSAGIDISDSSIKWIVIVPHKDSRRVLAWGSRPLPPGIVVEGAIQDEAALSEALSQVKSELGSVSHAHVALPEEMAFIFSMHVPGKSEREQVLRMIEFELQGRVPISPAEAVYDFNIIEEDSESGMEIGVMVFPRDLAESYARVFNNVGIEVLSLEVEVCSIARAISSDGADEPITLSVDFGLGRTGFAILKRGIPIFTSTVPIGGSSISKPLMEKLSISEERSEVLNNEEGLLPKDGKKSEITEIITKAVSTLAGEVVKHYHYWDTRRNERGDRVTPVGRVLLVGGSANVKGLDDYISERVQAPTSRPNVWQNVFSFEEYIPPIERKTSLQFVTAIGLALRGM